MAVLCVLAFATDPLDAYQVSRVLARAMTSTEVGQALQNTDDFEDCKDQQFSEHRILSPPLCLATRISPFLTLLNNRHDV